jgi:hypothetical protein
VKKVKKLSFVLNKEPINYIDFEVKNINGTLFPQEWEVLSQKDVKEKYLIDLVEKGDYSNFIIEGRLLLKNQTHCYFIVKKDGVYVQMSDYFTKEFEVLVCMASKNIIISKVVPS